MSNKCDELRFELLSIDEKREEVEAIQSLLDDLKGQYRLKIEEYEDMKAFGADFEEIESIFDEICELKKEIEDYESSIQDVPMNTYGRMSY